MRLSARQFAMLYANDVENSCSCGLRAEDDPCSSWQIVARSRANAGVLARIERETESNASRCERLRIRST
jgi:hypothetical protein